MSMGYQVGVTPLQMVAAMNAVANGGTWIQPRIVRAVTRDGVRTRIEPKAVRRVISPETAAQMLPILEAVTERGTAKLAQPHVEASLPVCQPFLRPQWHSETTAFRDGLCRNECVFQIAIAPGPSKPDISGAERIAQMEQHRDLP